MKKIAVFTSTRADYGLLYWLLMELKTSPLIDLKILVSGTHLVSDFGSTVNIINDDGFKITEKIEMLLASDSNIGIAKSVGLGVIGYAESLERIQADCIVILGDRFEALAMAQAALLMQVPIAHIHGGEVTEGAYDDAIRHAITKLSYFHFTSTECHRNRVIQLGECPSRVFNVGALGLDHLERTKLLNITELTEDLGFNLSKPYFLVTYHPATLANEPVEDSFNELLSALDYYSGYNILITYPNADQGGRRLIEMIEEFAASQPLRVHATVSLGQIRYLSVMKFAAAVIGNSSSGLIEAPSFGIPTINIGDRQAGRTCASSVLHSKALAKEIKLAIDEGLSSDFSSVVNPYGQGNAAIKISKVLESKTACLVKKFHDVEAFYK